MNFVKTVTAAFAFASLGGIASAQEETFITIGTGGQTGVYYVVGQSVCRLVNRDTATTGTFAATMLSRRPGSDRIGAMLRIGLDGQMTIASSAGSASAAARPGEDVALSVPSKRIAWKRGRHCRRTK